ncbi:MAG: hypothetical protein LKF52_01915 [Butyrivibrio sp.]|jgi:hypothetical protein|nr:hypothetical protein [Butyrivibrio sp.]
MTAKKWFWILISTVFTVLILMAGMVAWLDPFFHYHAPLRGFYYTLDNERSQNNGITRHFDYDSIITGTSMTENFKTSEFDRLFDADAVKVCYSGAMYKEINDNVRTGFADHKIRYVLRCIDDSYLITDKDASRTDLGSYPTYLYNKSIWDDTRYLLNRDVIFGYCIPMLAKRIQGDAGGMTSFDEYANWMDGVTFGRQAALSGISELTDQRKQLPLSDADAAREKANIEQNVTSLAAEHPETTFYYYFPPYSVALWGSLYSDGTAQQQIEEEKIAIELMLRYDNIRIFSFSTDTDITMNLDNYRDARHYGEWINSEILRRMAAGENQLTQDNYTEYLQQLSEIYLNYDYVGNLQ